MLLCKKDNGQEATEFDPHAVGVYRQSKPVASESDLLLAGHVPIELSRVIARFLGVCKDNSLTVEEVGKRKREVGLVVPGMYVARSKSKKIIDILYRELCDIKERCTHFEFEIVQDTIFKPVTKINQ